MLRMFLGVFNLTYVMIGNRYLKYLIYYDLYEINRVSTSLSRNVKYAVR
jgi:hypothetical protein